MCERSKEGAVVGLRENDGAAVGLLVTDQTAEQRRLASPIGTDQADALAVVEDESTVGEDGVAP